eukprot:6185629-Pleurochrysis_carterae.AAC.1
MDSAMLKEKEQEVAPEAARKNTTSTSTIPLHIGGGAGGDEKYRARPPKTGPAPSTSGGVATFSDIGRAAAAMEGFTVTYKE